MEYKEYLNQIKEGLIMDLSLELSKEGSSSKLASKEVDRIERDVTKIADKAGLRLDLTEAQPIRSVEGSTFLFLQDGIKRIKIIISLVSGDKSPHYRVKRVKHGNTN